MTPPAKTSPTKTADARRTALAVLRAVLDDRRPLDEALTGNAHFTKLETRDRAFCRLLLTRSEEHTSELQSLMRISYAVFCLKKKNKNGILHEDRHTQQH